MRALLTRRGLNRTLLARHGLLGRARAPAPAPIERLVALQAQEPFDPYVALAARLEGFRPDELSELIETRAVVRAQLPRATIHLATARDALVLHPLTLPVLARTFKSSWSRRAGDAHVAAVVAAGRSPSTASRPLQAARRGRSTRSPRRPSGCST